MTSGAIQRTLVALMMLLAAAIAQADRLSRLQSSNASLTRTLDDEALIKLALSSFTQAAQLGSESGLDGAAPVLG